jgi:putative toxin-antitoxin system antitoxin component (TIGR02293 family)
MASMAHATNPRRSAVPAEAGGAAVIRDIGGGRLPNVPAMRALPAALRALLGRGYSQDEIYALVVPKRTLARRQAARQPLSVEETDKALRLERIAAMAARIFGNPDKANRWMRSPKRELDGAAPLAFLASESGGRIVEDMLLRIDHGMLA